MKQSILAKEQTLEFRKVFQEGFQSHEIIASIRHDDACGNGHNTFSITGTLGILGAREPDEYGCLHDKIARHFPKLKPFIKWHLTSTDGPLHYLDNALYWHGSLGWRDGKPNSPPNEEHLKSTIVYGALPGDVKVEPMKLSAAELTDWLKQRLPKLLEAFQRDIESLGLTF